MARPALSCHNKFVSVAGEPSVCLGFDPQNQGQRLLHGSKGLGVGLADRPEKTVAGDSSDAAAYRGALVIDSLIGRYRWPQFRWRTRTRQRNDHDQLVLDPGHEVIDRDDYRRAILAGLSLAGCPE